MTFGDLMAATSLAHPDTPVRIRTGDGDELELTGVDIPLTGLDEGKRLGDEPEGHSRADITVWLTCGKRGKR